MNLLLEGQAAADAVQDIQHDHASLKKRFFILSYLQIDTLGLRVRCTATAQNVMLRYFEHQYRHHCTTLVGRHILAANTKLSTGR